MSKKRSKARALAVQALYQWQIAGQQVGDIVTQFLEENDRGTFEIPYFKDLLSGVLDSLNEIDAILQPVLSRPVEQVDPVERGILRLGVYEFLHHPEVPYRVVINESVELAKTFGAEQGHRFVNGVLDKLARSLRKDEIRARG